MKHNSTIERLEKQAKYKLSDSVVVLRRNSNGDIHDGNGSVFESREAAENYFPEGVKIVFLDLVADGL